MNEQTTQIMKRCTLKAAFDGKGVDSYTSVEAKKRYARSLERLADKCFWAPLAALVATGFTNRTDFFVYQCIIAGAFVFMGVWLRHCACATHDALSEKKPRRKSSSKLSTTGVAETTHPSSVSVPVPQLNIAGDLVQKSALGS